nr:DEAD/DEAH box helicase [bacterium]
MNETASRQEHQPLPPKKTRERYHWKDGQERAPRPMDFYLPEVLRQLDLNQVVIVQAETGVGKTTRIPQAILDNDPKARIDMTQTKRPPVRMNGGFIAKEMGSMPGSEVGWRLYPDENVVSMDTRLTLMIDQSLTNRIRKEKKLPEGYIIIDEAHERTVQIDILLALIKEYLPNS